MAKIVNFKENNEESTLRDIVGGKLVNPNSKENGYFLSCKSGVFDEGAAEKLLKKTESFVNKYKNKSDFPGENISDFIQIMSSTYDILYAFDQMGDKESFEKASGFLQKFEDLFYEFEGMDAGV